VTLVLATDPDAGVSTVAAATARGLLPRSPARVRAPPRQARAVPRARHRQSLGSGYPLDADVKNLIATQLDAVSQPSDAHLAFRSQPRLPPPHGTAPDGHTRTAAPAVQRRGVQASPVQGARSLPMIATTT
jgi:hypothetical protein